MIARRGLQMHGARIRSALTMAMCVLAVVAALVTAIIGAGTNPVTLLPRLTASSGGSTLYVDFASVVNLPLGARVLARGTQIGTVQSIGLVPDAARLSIDLAQQARVPAGSTAELRQSTLLGDIYVALIPPEGTSPSSSMLPDGAVIGVADTDPGPQVEDIIVNLADFMSGGSILRVQDSIRQINESVDTGGDLAGASRVGAQDITDLAAGTRDLDAMITSLQKASTEMAANPDALGYSFGDKGQFGLRAVFNSVNEGFKLVAGSSALAAGLSWLAPRLAQLNPFLDKLVPLLRSHSAHSTQFNGNIGALIDVTRTDVIPFVKDGAISVDQVTLDDADVTRSVASVLRMMGALR
ncbi:MULTISPECIES: MlaD family protein [unclassified Gordonia (in: high G+C Gram-positive bacteria)]